MINSKKENAFKKVVQGFTDFDVDEGVTVSEDALMQSVEFIGSNLDPEDVFPPADLHEWAKRNNYK